MAEWGFRCYLDGAGTDVVRAWYDNGTKEVQNIFRSRLRILSSRTIQSWGRPTYDTLSDDGAGLGEIIFEANGIAYRPLGFHMRTEKAFVIVLPASKQGKKNRIKWDPRNALAEALKRKQEVLNDNGRAIPLWLPLE
ncbi:MAG: hypothetical protein EOO38_03410 [Cytophagaceae bacterium]|nr:MAG: hypothetical protein EOO38_03410 [Cytophagaceae bacterium]